MHLCFFHLDLSALDAAHIQHIIDEGKQMIAGSEDLTKIILSPVPYCQCCSQPAW